MSVRSLITARIVKGRSYPQERKQTRTEKNGVVARIANVLPFIRRTNGNERRRPTSQERFIQAEPQIRWTKSKGRMNYKQSVTVDCAELKNVVKGLKDEQSFFAPQYRELFKILEKSQYSGVAQLHIIATGVHPNMDRENGTLLRMQADISELQCTFAVPESFLTSCRGAFVSLFRAR